MSSGRIFLILGPMSSGKSSELKRRLRNARIGRKKVFAIKNEIDHRKHDKKGLLHSRDGSNPVEATSLAKLSDFSLKGVSGAWIGIDEVQFFEKDDLVKFCVTARKQGNVVIASGLSSDFNRNMWPSVAALLPLHDGVPTFLSAVCDLCGGEATSTKKLGGAAKLVDVDGTYIPVCNTCWESDEPAQPPNEL